MPLVSPLCIVVLLLPRLKTSTSFSVSKQLIFLVLLAKVFTSPYSKTVCYTCELLLLMFFSIPESSEPSCAVFELLFRLEFLSFGVASEPVFTAVAKELMKPLNVPGRDSILGYMLLLRF